MFGLKQRGDAPLTTTVLYDHHINDLRKSGLDLHVSYCQVHRARFLKTDQFIPATPNPKAKVLEAGAIDLFQVALKHVHGYAEIVGTKVSPNVEHKRFFRTISIGRHTSNVLTISVDLESDILPFENESFEFILCGEVIEHMDVDPMFMLAEFNRVLKQNGKLLITTPNCCSARNFWRISQGYRPHLYMQYERSRSPYRHNIEYDIHLLSSVVQCAGFESVLLETHDVFDDPMPEALDLLQRCELPTDHRGDCIFLLAKKVSNVIDRWPAGLYV
ncbi:MAG: methyltransferase domain-containing protein [Rhizobiales bacterium]|jgi:SAM-dependent methyltransferase|nr:methyltransferase domain-containing protein [Hyphomicrobiales bacterium]